MRNRLWDEHAPGEQRVARRTPNHPTLALQQLAGNRAVAKLLARKPSATASVQIGKLAIKASGGNLAEWAAGEVPDSLQLTSQRGRHSAELQALSKGRKRIASLTVTTAPVNKEGEQLDLGSLVIEIKNARVADYTLDGKTETWSLVDFDGVHRTKTTRKVS